MVALREGPVGLLEGRKDARDVLRRYADARVVHFDEQSLEGRGRWRLPAPWRLFLRGIRGRVQCLRRETSRARRAEALCHRALHRRWCARIAGDWGDADGHVALHRKLDGVGEQVGKDLAHARRVSHGHRRERRWVGVKVELKALAKRLLRVQRNDRFDDADKVKLLQAHAHVFRANLGEVEHVLDDPEEVVAAPLHRGDEAAEAAVGGGGSMGLKHLNDTDNAVKGSLDLVRHVRKEEVPRARRPLRDLDLHPREPTHLLVALLLRRDVADDPREEVVRARPHFRHGKLHRKSAPVPPHSAHLAADPDDLLHPGRQVIAHVVVVVRRVLGRPMYSALI
eukprot:Opistho-1_new@16421